MDEVCGRGVGRTVEFSKEVMMHSAYKLDKQDDNIQPRHTPFRIWNCTELDQKKESYITNGTELRAQKKSTHKWIIDL